MFKSLSPNRCLATALVSLQFLFILGPISAEAQETPDIGGAYRYTVFGFYDPGTFQGTEFVKRMQHISSEVEGEADITLVDVSKPGSASLLGRYGVTDIPSVVIVTPDGIITGGVRGIPNTSDIVRSLVPRPMAKIIRAIQNDKVVLVILKGDNMDDDDTTKNSVEEVRKIFRKSMETIELDVATPEGSEVATSLGLDASGARPFSVAVLSAQGVIDSFTAPVSTKQLLGSFQRVLASKSGCGGANEGGLKNSCDD